MEGLLKTDGKQKLILYIFIFCSAYAGVCSIGYIMTGNVINNGTGMLSGFLLLSWAYIKVFIKNGRFAVPMPDLAFGSISALAVLLGKVIYDTHSTTLVKNNIILSILVLSGGIMFNTLFFSCIRLCIPYWDSIRLAADKNKKKWVIKPVMAWALYFIVYFICYLSYYPGIFSYDMGTQTYQALGMAALDNHHPVLHTLLWKCCILLGGGNSVRGLVIYSVCQIIFVVVCYMYILKWMQKNNFSRMVIYITYIYYLIVPTLHIFAMVTTKDVLFSCCFVIYILSVTDLQKEKTGKNILKCCIWGVLSVMLRNNMIMVTIMATIISFFIKKADTGNFVWKQFLIVSAVGLVVLKGVFPMAGILQGDRVNESLSVPFSQLAYVYNNSRETLKEDEVVLLESYLPDIGSYNPRFADTIKWSFNNGLYNENPSVFWKLYFLLAFRNPGDYLAAFLDLNVDYWYPMAAFPDAFSGRAYIETGIIYMNEYPLVSDSKFPYLHKLYESVASFSNNIMRIPVLYQFFSLSFPTVSLFICIYLAVSDRLRGVVYMYIVLALLLATYLLGPVSNFRYVYTFYMAFPVYFSSVLSGNAKDWLQSG